MKIAIAAAASVLLFPSGATASTRAVEGPVGLGRTAYVNGPRVRPDRIIEDSRCPINARCAWAGRVVLRATVFGGSWKRRLNLTLGESVGVADGKLTLMSVTPGRLAGKRIDPRRLRFAFAFDGGI